jgi:hypothetical protein
VISLYGGDLAGCSQYGELSFGHAGLWTKSRYLSRGLFQEMAEILVHIVIFEFCAVRLYKETIPSYGQPRHATKTGGVKWITRM